MYYFVILGKKMAQLRLLNVSERTLRLFDFFEELEYRLQKLNVGNKNKEKKINELFEKVKSLEELLKKDFKNSLHKKKIKKLSINDLLIYLLDKLRKVLVKKKFSLKGGKNVNSRKKHRH
ncbi:MAG: hypothetical protein AMS24_02265 [Chlamydiae bacterium SM23_39]|nr:MAG: hypothetical protein AMS24_02265 [Chlamydiae bacterium SM23_39]